MPRGQRYHGQPFDFSSRRSIEIRPSGEGDLIECADDSVTVDHFYHAGSFWRARIPLNAVACIFGQAFNFSAPKMRPGPDGKEIILDRRGLPKRKIPILNHLQARLVLEPNQAIRLYPLDASDPGHPAHQIRDFVYSVEAVGPVGVNFNLRDALAGNLISAHRFLSTEEMVFERIVVERQVVTETPPLRLADDEKRSLLVKSLLRSHRAGTDETYYLYRFCGTNNCTSNPLAILDSTVRYAWPYRLGSWLYRLPLNPRLYLRARGMDTDASHIRLVRDEFAQFIAARETQQRKRDYVRRITRLRRSARDARAG